MHEYNSNIECTKCNNCHIIFYQSYYKFFKYNILFKLLSFKVQKFALFILILYEHDIYICCNFVLLIYESNKRLRNILIISIRFVHDLDTQNCSLHDTVVHKYISLFYACPKMIREYHV